MFHLFGQEAKVEKALFALLWASVSTKSGLGPIFGAEESQGHWLNGLWEPLIAAEEDFLCAGSAHLVVRFVWAQSNRFPLCRELTIQRYRIWTRDNFRDIVAN